MAEQAKSLREVRFKTRKTQIQLFIETGVSPSRISLIESSKMIPTEKEKAALARGLSVPVDSIAWPKLAEEGTA